MKPIYTTAKQIAQEIKWKTKREAIIEQLQAQEQANAAQDW